MNELNARQWRLYRLLREQGDEWTLQREIAAALPEFYPIADGQAFHDSGARLLMTRDIGEINESGIIQKIIISGKKGVKLANREEAQQYIAGKYSAVFRSLARVRVLEQKAGLDGQARLVFGRERGIIEAFTDSGSFSFANTASICKQFMNLKQNVDF